MIRFGFGVCLWGVGCGFVSDFLLVGWVCALVGAVTLIRLMRWICGCFV